MDLYSSVEIFLWDHGDALYREICNRCEAGDGRHDVTRELTERYPEIDEQAVIIATGYLWAFAARGLGASISSGLPWGGWAPKEPKSIGTVWLDGELVDVSDKTGEDEGAS